MGYTMKYTNGKKADSSAFPFKVEASSAISDSPAKLGAGGAAGGLGSGAAIGAGIGSIIPGLGTATGAVIGGGIGMLAGGLSHNVRKNKEQRVYKDVLEQEGLQKNFWGKIGFGGARAKERAARVAELQEQDQMGIDRERIESRGGVTAGPGAE